MDFSFPSVMEKQRMFQAGFHNNGLPSGIGILDPNLRAEYDRGISARLGMEGLERKRKMQEELTESLRKHRSQNY